jgi:hypothetical protein
MLLRNVQHSTLEGIMTNLDQYLDEHFADKRQQEAEAEAHMQAELAIKQTEWRKKEEEERKRRVAKRNVFLAKIAAAATRGDRKIRHDLDEGHIYIDGVDTHYWIDITEDRNRQSPWRSTPNGRTRITVGVYGERKSYPQRKDGTHNYEAIAGELLIRADHAIATAKWNNQQRSNEAPVKNLAAELSMASYQHILRASQVADMPVLVNITIARAMTVADAKRLVLTLRTLGFELKS